jgi:hypothetical protein
MCFAVIDFLSSRAPQELARLMENRELCGDIEEEISQYIEVHQRIPSDGDRE